MFSVRRNRGHGSAGGRDVQRRIGGLVDLFLLDGSALTTSRRLQVAVVAGPTLLAQERLDLVLLEWARWMTQREFADLQTFGRLGLDLLAAGRTAEAVDGAVDALGERFAVGDDLPFPRARGRDLPRDAADQAPILRSAAHSASYCASSSSFASMRSKIAASTLSRSISRITRLPLHP